MQTDSERRSLTKIRISIASLQPQLGYFVDENSCKDDSQQSSQRFELFGTILRHQCGWNGQLSIGKCAICMDDLCEWYEE